MKVSDLVRHHLFHAFVRWGLGLHGIIHLAEYRNAIGAVPSDSDTLVIRTREWIAGHENIDSVMLLTTQPESSDPIYILVTEVFHTSQEIDVDSVSTILTLFKNNGFAAFAD